MAKTLIAEAFNSLDMDALVADLKALMMTLRIGGRGGSGTMVILYSYGGTVPAHTASQTAEAAQTVACSASRL